MKKNILKILITVCTLMICQHVQSQTIFSVRNDGVILRNGQSFFPYGFYTDEKYDKQAMLNHVNTTGKSGFNVIHLERLDNDALTEIFNAAQANKQYIIYGPYKAIKLPALHAVYDKIKNQPSLMGYNIADDMQDGVMVGYPSNVADVQELHDDLKNYDPKHITVVALGGSGGQTDVFSTRRFDASAEEIYPVNGGSEINMVYKSALGVVKNCEQWKQSPWLALQTFNWAENADQRMPTFGEYYNMLYQSIVAGAKGLLLYSYHVGGNGCDSDPFLWNGIKTTPVEIDKISAFLTDGKLTRTELGAGLYAATWENNEQVLAIVVNAGKYKSYFNPDNNVADTRNVSLSLPLGIVSNAVPAFDNRPATMSLVNGKLEGKIKLLEVQAYIFNKKPTSIESLQNQNTISLHPNPAKTELYISGNLLENAIYEITSIEGKSLKAGDLNKSKINIETLNTGIYIIKIKTEAGESVQRFVKE